jgi:hypothetical protein
MTDCDCEPIDLGDGEIIEHDGDCPRYWDHLTTAEGIAVVRRYMMMADAPAGPYADPDLTAEVTARCAAGITARAVELGLERP